MWIENTRRLRGDLIEVSQILNGYENIDRNICSRLMEERRTRGHGITLAMKQYKLDIRTFSFSQRTVNERNRLLADCVGASSVNVFKNKFDIIPKKGGVRGTISANMKASEQCGIAAAKGNQILGFIRRNIVYKEKELIIPLYKTIVRPHLEYCIQAWRPYRKKDIDMLERVQRR